MQVDIKVAGGGDGGVSSLSVSVPYFLYSRTLPLFRVHAVARSKACLLTLLSQLASTASHSLVYWHHTPSERRLLFTLDFNLGPTYIDHVHSTHSQDST